MTVPVPCPSAALDSISVAPRKRRRRAPASGASDDCFACSKRNLRCDRRRPYCSQCLEVGSECSGYKTQLTWGVGVASRGKLRGLSLPIAKSAPVSKISQKTRPRASSTTSRSGSDAGGNEDEDIGVKLEGEIPIPTSSYTTYDFINMVPTSPASMQGSLGPDWTMSISEERMRSPHHSVESVSQQQPLPQPVHRLQPPMLRYDDEINLSSSTPSLSGYSDADYSPLTQSYTADDVSYMGSPMPMFNSYSPHDSPVAHYAIPTDPRGPTSCPDQYYSQSEISSSISSHPTIFEISEQRRLAPSPAGCNMSEASYDDEIVGPMSISNHSDFIVGPHMSNSWNADDDEYAARAAAEAGLRSLSEPEYFHVGLPLSQDISPRLGFYLNYYEKIICPITVAIDSPRNPYRSHILSLATGSQSLQHAICALASCNLRMRRKQTLRQEHWRRVYEAERQDQINGGFSRPSFSRRVSGNELFQDTPLDDASVNEEYQHRSQAVALLNQQLMDPSKAKDDSVLATLFILCHYRMCESGIAQFKTQFAGVKKLLGMRSSGVETGNWGWMETIFTFFDAITASVNDREAQLRGGYVEMIASYPTPDFALENLAGCDGKLFKTIATLGRLNLLSQRRPVLDPLKHLQARAPASIPQPRPRPSGQALVDFYKFHGDKFDGNGFGHTLDEEDLQISFSTSPPIQSPTYGDEDPRRGQFWAEWKETRLALQTWEFDPNRLLASLGNITPSPTQIRDFGYVSEAFRHAALLYTERLANPNLPSSHLSIQNLVAQVLFYITSLNSGEGGDAMGKFLLWPLFVAGSECVSELHRGIVRSRCREIGARGGYLNNLAGLDVLEMIWKEGDQGVGGRGPFKWTGLMDGVDGEYIMV